MKPSTIKNWSIRRAEPDEVSAVAEMTQSIFQDFFPIQPFQYFPFNAALVNGGKKICPPPACEIFVAVDKKEKIQGSVLFMREFTGYDYGEIAPTLKLCAGIQFLGVRPDSRGFGIGKALTKRCIQRAAELNLKGVILHATRQMKIAWAIYERIGFERLPDLDTIEKGIYHYGFCLSLMKRSIGPSEYVYHRYEPDNLSAAG